MITVAVTVTLAVAVTLAVTLAVTVAVTLAVTATVSSSILERCVNKGIFAEVQCVRMYIGLFHYPKTISFNTSAAI